MSRLARSAEEAWALMLGLSITGCDEVGMAGGHIEGDLVKALRESVSLAKCGSKWFYHKDQKLNGPSLLRK